MAVVTGNWTGIEDGRSGYVVQWTALKLGDTAAAINEFSNVVGFADRSVQVEGTFGGATVALQGSNDGVNFETLNDPASVPLTFTTAKIKAILEATRQIAPSITGGDGTTALTVSLFVRKLR